MSAAPSEMVPDVLTVTLALPRDWQVWGGRQLVTEVVAVCLESLTREIAASGAVPLGGQVKVQVVPDYLMGNEDEQRFDVVKASVDCLRPATGR